MIFSRLRRYAVMVTGDYSKIFSRMKIPVLPQVAIRLIEVMRKPEAHLDEIARVIEGDPGLSSQVLKVVNSALYALPSQISSINRAVSILGLKKIENIAISYAVAGAVRDPGAQGFDMDTFWADSLYRALFARETAAYLECEPEEGFAGGLLQDIALPVLLTSWFDAHRPVYVRWLGSGRRLSEVEEEELSWNHAQAGAWIAREWRLPDTLVCSIGLHASDVHSLDELGLGRSVPAAVALSSLVPSCNYGGSLDMRPLVAMGEELGIPKKILRETAEKCDELFVGMARCFSIDTSKVLALSESLGTMLEQ